MNAPLRPMPTRAQDQTDPQALHPNEFHQSISSASGPWIPCDCHDGDWRAHFAGLQQILRNILAEDKRKEAR